MNRFFFSLLNDSLTPVVESTRRCSTSGHVSLVGFPGSSDSNTVYALLMEYVFFSLTSTHGALGAKKFSFIGSYLGCERERREFCLS
jgi:hypothetical protein